MRKRTRKLTISFLWQTCLLLSFLLRGVAAAGPSVAFISRQFTYLDEYDTFEDLRQAGLEVGVLHWNEVSLESLKPFNAICLTDIPPANERGRLQKKANEALQAIDAYCRQGGGALACMGTGGWDRGRVAANLLLKRWGAELLDEQVTDAQHLFRQTRGIRWRYSWTRDLSPSPLTRGLNAIYYPAQSWRADGQKTLYAPQFDGAWQVLVRGERSARSVRTRAGIMQEGAATYSSAPPIVGARELEKGRAAVFALWPNWTFWGARCPAMEGIVWEAGANGLPSDTGKLCARLLRWLAEPSLKSGAFGGYVTPEKPATRPDKYPGHEVDWAKLKFPPAPTWKHFKVLAGARTYYSGGKGSVEEYVKAARDAGYQAILFAEKLDLLTREKWDRLRKECKAASSPEFLALPGLDFTSLQGDAYVAFGEFDFPKPPGLAKDGKHMDDTYKFWGGQMHSGFLAISRLHAHPDRDPQMLKNMTACAVYTYRNGTLVDDSLDYFLALNAQFHNLVPLALHLVSSPGEVSHAAAAPWQNVWRVRDAADLKEQITPHRQPGLLYWLNPHRAYLSGGPKLVEWSGLNVMYWAEPTEGSDRWKIRFKVSSPAGIRAVKVYDRTRLYLRFANEGPECSREFPGYHDRQHVFHIVAQDARGRRLLSPGIRIRFSRTYANQCGDHQNTITACLQRNREGKMIYTNGTTMGVYAGWMPTWNAPCPVDPRNKYPPAWDGVMTGSGGKAGVVARIKGGLVEGGENSASANLYELAGPDVQILDQVVRWKYPDGTPPRRDTAPTYRTIPTEFIDYVVRRVTPTARFERAGISLNEITVTAKKDFAFDPRQPVPLHGYAFSDYGSRQEGERDHFFVSFADGRALNHVGPRGAKTWYARGEMRTGNYYAAYPNVFGAGAVFPLTPVRVQVVVTSTLGAASFGLPLSGQQARKGDSWTFRFLAASASTTLEQGNQVFEDIRHTLGIGQPPAFHVQTTSGQVKDTTGRVLAEASEGVFTASFSRTRMPADLFIMVHDLTDSWTAAQQVDGGPLSVVSLDKGTAYTTLDLNQRNRHLVLGHPVLCSSSEVRIVAQWAKKRCLVYAHNPTGSAVTATIRMNPAFKGLPRGQKEVALPAGGSVAESF